MGAYNNYFQFNFDETGRTMVYQKDSSRKIGTARPLSYLMNILIGLSACPANFTTGFVLLDEVPVDFTETIVASLF